MTLLHRRGGYFNYATLAVFYGSTACEFNGNTVTQAVGQGYGFKAFGSGLTG